MAFLVRFDSAAVLQCAKCLKYGSNCYKCFNPSCEKWYCDSCDQVHNCERCGGNFCYWCRPCYWCTAYGPTRPHPHSTLCDTCGNYLDLASVGCAECFRMTCHGDCRRRLHSNYACCNKDKCSDCSAWKEELNSRRRVCWTCPTTSSAVLKVIRFESTGQINDSNWVVE